MFARALLVELLFHNQSTFLGALSQQDRGVQTPSDNDKGAPVAEREQKEGQEGRSTPGSQVPTVPLRVVVRGLLWNVSSFSLGKKATGKRAVSAAICKRKGFITRSEELSPNW